MNSNNKAGWAPTRTWFFALSLSPTHNDLLASLLLFPPSSFDPIQSIKPWSVIHSINSLTHSTPKANLLPSIPPSLSLSLSCYLSFSPLLCPLVFGSQSEPSLHFSIPRIEAKEEEQVHHLHHFKGFGNRHSKGILEQQLRRFDLGIASHWMSLCHLRFRIRVTWWRGKEEQDLFL